MATMDASNEAHLSPVIVTIDEGEAIRPFGLDMRILLPTEQTDGVISLLVATHKPGEGPPTHIHYRQQECFFVVEGDYEITVGDRTQLAGPGTLVFIPPAVPHSFHNVGTTNARMLDWSLPGAQDHYFRIVHQQQTDGSFDASNLVSLGQEYDTTFPTKS